MPHYNIRGITINFPFEAYDVQKVFMEKVIYSLQSKQNGLLESPTGTGKTLTLLCAALAWREAWHARRQLERAMCTWTDDKRAAKKSLLSELDSAVSTNPSLEDYNFDVPKIIYASRTHSQLAQTVRQLKNTTYRPKMCVLGSREQLCIHPDVIKVASNSARTALCRQKISKKTCEFHKRVNDANAELNLENEIMDIEDIVKFGEQHRACPYYLSRENQQKAEIIFVPYNYLIDVNARKTQNLDLKNCIVIFDEAHNLESSCGEAASFEITPTDLANCIQEAQICYEYALKPGYSGDFDASAFDILKGRLLRLEDEIDKLEIPSSTQELIRPGEFMYELLNLIGVNGGNFELLQKAMEAAINILAGIELDEAKRHRKYAINHLLLALKMVFRSDFFLQGEQTFTHTKYYKVHIQNEKLTPNLDVWAASSAKTFGRKVSFWCFSPGLAMKDILDQGVRSVILASGTLSPLESFASEFHINFKVRLENPHIIDANQALIAVVPKGPSGHVLNSSYESRNNLSYKSDLGNAIVNFSRIIPDGLLVFFPSYGVMGECIDTWKRPVGTARSIWDLINQYKKAFVEPKNRQEFGQAMEDFYKKIADVNTKGAVFFAVCRGKVSEGVDFADSRGRAVVITGIPYASSKDPKVILKKKILDDAQAKDRSVNTNISGNEWYKQQAIRAVNQAIGRVIRHRKDYGAILLCDERFASPAVISQLSAWVRSSIAVYKNFGETQGQVAKFFKSMEGMKGLTTLSERNIKGPSAPDTQAGGHHALLADESLKSIFEQLIPNPPQKRKNIVVQYEATMPSSALSTNGAPSLRRSLLDTINSSQPGNILEKNKQNFTFSFHKTELNQPKVKLQSKLNHTTPELSKTLEGSSMSKNISHNKVVTSGDAKEYLEQIKSVIGPIGYGNFQQLLREYRSKMVTINQFIDRLIQLFERHQRLDMARGFKVFIPLKHHDLFQSAVNKLDIPANDEQAPDSVLSASKRKGDDSHFEFPSSDSAPSASKRKHDGSPASSMEQASSMTSFFGADKSKKFTSTEF